VSSAGRPVRFSAVVGDTTSAVEVLPLADGRYQVTVDGRTRVVDAHPAGAGTWSLLVEHAVIEATVLARGDEYTVAVGGQLHQVRLLDERARRRAARRDTAGGAPEVRAAMPGKVIAVLVEVGTVVAPGQGLLVLEAMKMENEVPAPRAGTVASIRVRAGQAVEAGEILLTIA